MSMPPCLQIWSVHANTWHDAWVSEWETMEEAREGWIKAGHQARIVDKPLVLYETGKHTGRKRSNPTKVE